MFTYHIGDATQPDLDGPYVIAHILSDAGAYGAGFAAAVANRYPEAKRQFQRWASGHAGKVRLRLGAVHFVDVDPAEERYVANMVAQHGLISRSNPHPLDLSALTTCLHQVAAFAIEQIAMPRIGCRLGGGTWHEVEPVVASTLRERDVHVYDLNP